MRIAFYTDTYLPNIDGVVSQIVASKKELEKRGHYVHVFTSGSSEERRAADRTVSVYSSVRFPPYPQYKWAIFPYTSVSEVEKMRLQLIHCHALASMGLAAVYSAKALRLPLVGTFHTMAPLATHYFIKHPVAQEVLSKAAWHAIRVFYAPFDVVTTPSQATAALLREHGVEDVKVISNGISLKTFNRYIKGREAMRHKLGIKKDEKLITFVGRVTEEKNVDVLIKSAKLAEAQDNKFKLIIVGSGPALQNMKVLAREVGLKKIVFTGAVKHSEIPAYLAATDWQITASTFETQGIGIIEGLACGKPCIGANSLAIPEAIKQGRNGFIFEPGDVGECTEQILNAVSMDELKYEKMRQAAAKGAKRYSVEKSTSELLRLYEKYV